MSVEQQAAEAAALWGGRVLRLIRNRENAVFEIALPQGRAALRLHRMGYQDQAAIRSELWWCAALAARGVAVPSALPSKAGRLLEVLQAGRTASVIDWVEGEALGEAGVPFKQPLEVVLQRHHALGRLLAHLHAETDRLDLPADFTRPRWDIDGLVGEAPQWGRFWEHPTATPAQAGILRRARAFLRERLTEHARDGDFGLIHADVLRENLLVRDGALTLIDFDDSGYGFRLYDLGTVLSQNLYEPAYPAIRDALIEGYSETRAASSDLVELFTLARTCASVGWTMPRLSPDDPICARHIARATGLAERLMR